MKKRYILETSDNCQRIALIGDCDGCVVMMDKAVDKLQDADKAIEEAYLQGKHDAEQDLARAAYDEAYQKGLCDGMARNENGCVGCKYDNVRIDRSPCVYCCNAYSNQWMAKEKSDEIKAGDEVKNTLELMNNAVGYFIEPTNNEYYRVLRRVDGKIDIAAWHKENCVKTGKHSDAVVQLLAEMKGEQRNCSTCKHNRSGNAQCIDCGRFERYDMWESKEVTE